MPLIGNIGPGELILLLVIILVIFGPGRLPEIGNAVGKGIREFRKAATDVTEATRVDAQPAPPPTVPAAIPPTTASTMSQSSAPTDAATQPATVASPADDEADARRRYQELKARFEQPADESHGDAGRPTA